jgi:hypothetical protein
MPAIKTPDGEKLFGSIFLFNPKVFGLALGLLSGLAIFILTNILLIKGGSVTPYGVYVVGPHLQLLNQIFIGYSVSFLGSIIGFAYCFALGTIAGAAIGWIYNAIVRLRN